MFNNGLWIIGHTIVCCFSSVGKWGELSTAWAPRICTRTTKRLVFKNLSKSQPKPTTSQIIITPKTCYYLLCLAIADKLRGDHNFFPKLVHVGIRHNFIALAKSPVFGRAFCSLRLRRWRDITIILSLWYRGEAESWPSAFCLLRLSFSLRMLFQYR